MENNNNKEEKECRLCGTKPCIEILCSSCLRCEEKRVTFQNDRHNSRQRLSVRDWLQVLSYCDFACKACKKKHSLLTLDHISPLSKGGLNVKENIQPLCSSCHDIKSSVETKLTGNKKKRQEAKEIILENKDIFS